MVWWVKTLEIADESGKGTGKYRRVAKSDEGGGTHGLCEHCHDSVEEAQACEEARKNEGPVTGIPYMERPSPP